MYLQSVNLIYAIINNRKTMRFPSNKTLVKISVYVAVGGISAAMYMRYKIQERIKNYEYYRQAFKALRGNAGVVGLLGEPIKDMGFDLTDTEKNNCDGQTAHFEVAVKGPKDRGHMFFWSKRIDDIWQLQRLELELKSQPDKRFLIVKEQNKVKDSTASDFN